MNSQPEQGKSQSVVGKLAFQLKQRCGEKKTNLGIFCPLPQLNTQEEEEKKEETVQLLVCSLYVKDTGTIKDQAASCTRNPIKSFMFPLIIFEDRKTPYQNAD